MDSSEPDEDSGSSPISSSGSVLTGPHRQSAYLNVNDSTSSSNQVSNDTTSDSSTDRSSGIQGETGEANLNTSSSDAASDIQDSVDVHIVEQAAASPILISSDDENREAIVIEEIRRDVSPTLSNLSPQEQGVPAVDAVQAIAEEAQPGSLNMEPNGMFIIQARDNSSNIGETSHEHHSDLINLSGTRNLSDLPPGPVIIGEANLSSPSRRSAIPSVQSLEEPNILLLAPPTGNVPQAEPEPALIRPAVQEARTSRDAPPCKRQRTTSDDSPMKKEKKRDDNSDDDDDDDGMTCTVCLDHWTSSGEHRLVAMKCGHLFGFSWIDRWIKNQKPAERKCPTCKTKAKMSDARNLYGRKIQMIDTTELEEFREKNIKMAFTYKGDFEACKHGSKAPKYLEGKPSRRKPSSI